jgi:hypothetical protein
MDDPNRVAKSKLAGALFGLKPKTNANSVSAIPLLGRTSLAGS